MCSSLSRQPHKAKNASKRLGSLFRFQKHFTSLQLLKLYKGLIHPCLECWCYVYDNSSTHSLLDAVLRKVICVLNSSVRTANVNKYCITICEPRIECCVVAAFHSVNSLWNVLLSYVFPDVNNLSSSEDTYSTIRVKEELSLCWNSFFLLACVIGH